MIVMNKCESEDQTKTVEPRPIEASNLQPLAMSTVATVAASVAHLSGKKAKAAVNVTKSGIPKPKRPLSAYNIFFQYEREKIVSNVADDTPVTMEMLKIETKRAPKKRRHRKSHGKIGFADLARRIAEQWKVLDPESRTVFEACAAKEKQRYQEELKAWKHVKKNEILALEQAAMNKDVAERAEIIAATDGIEESTLNGLNSQSFASLLNGLTAQAMAGLNGASASYMQQSFREIDEVQDYLQITQQVVDMARASLTLPLFANLQQQPNGLTNWRMTGHQAPTNLALDAALRLAGGGQSSILNHLNSNTNNSNSLQFTTGSLVNQAYGNTGLNNSVLNNSMLGNHNESDGQHNQMMQSLESQLHGGYQNQYRDWDPSSALQVIQAAREGAVPQDYGDVLGQSQHQDQSLINSLTGLGGLQSAQDAERDELMSLINASLRDQF